MKRLKYTFKTDTLFKLLFVKYPDLLMKLVAELLDMKIEDIEEFRILNPEISPESLKSKSCKFDIHMIVCGQLLDLEIQVKDEKNLPERSLFSWARDYSLALDKGENYSKLPRTIIINIINFKLFKCKEYHSEFRPLEITRYTQLSDKMSLKFYELKKLPRTVTQDNKLLLWLRLFKADTEEELIELEKSEVPEMMKAIDAYRNIVISDELREKENERMRVMADHDNAQRLKNAEDRAERRGERRGEKRGEKIGEERGVKIGEERADTKWKKIVSDKDNAIADRDAVISEKDALIAELRVRLGE